MLIGVDRLARFVDLAGAYDATVWALTLARGLATALTGAAAYSLIQQRPPARALARLAVLVSALLLTLELGVGLAPNSLTPGTQGPIVGAYWVYAVVVIFVLRER